MTVDAVVYCNCYETGRLREPPPHPEYVFVSENGGYLDCSHPDLEALIEFDSWLSSRACEHPSGWLLIHHLGNISRIGIIRDELTVDAAPYPIILKKVVYNGVHAGDFLTLEEVKLLADELAHLDGFECGSQANTEMIRVFREQMRELVDASQSVNKPICF